jgi:hypothetical protein
MQLEHMAARMDPASRVLLSDGDREFGPSIGEASARSTRRCMLYPSAAGIPIKEWTGRSGHLEKAPSQGGGSGRMTHETCLPSTKYSSFLRPICLLMITSSRSLCIQPHVIFFPGRGSRTRSTHLQKPRAAKPPSCKISSCKTRAQNARGHVHQTPCADPAARMGPSMAMEAVVVHPALSCASQADASAASVHTGQEGPQLTSMRLSVLSKTIST